MDGVFDYLSDSVVDREEVESHAGELRVRHWLKIGHCCEFVPPRTWHLKIDPAAYLKRYPEGEHAELAREFMNVDDTGGDAPTSSDDSDGNGNQE